jgi:uncharacterized protein (TIGR02266 family)
MADTPEKRRDQRVPLILRVAYPDLGRGLQDTTENLSAGGLFIRTDLGLAVGQRLPLEISFPGLLEPLTIEVEVVRQRHTVEEGPPGVAVRVPSDRPDDRYALARFSASLQGSVPPPRRYRILVVEDNSLVTEMFRNALQRIGAAEPHPLDVQVRFAADGRQALAAVAEERPDLVMTDLFMPVLDGFALVERLRADPANKALAVLVVSAGDSQARRRALELGADVFLAKPVQFAELVGTVRLLLTRR